MNRTKDVLVIGGRAILASLADNGRGLAVLAGAAWGYVGIRGFSPDAANIVAGVLLMAVGAWPYVARTIPRRPR